jgi:2-polyprenyl-6-methoxyphenol hydroxylase-like FAD-dependent oxidoreductase
MQELETDVMVVGAGPVGLTLAMDLAARGVQVVIAEIRRYAEPPNVKCNHVAARACRRSTRTTSSFAPACAAPS